MENKINIAELLKDCPKGMELDCTMFDDNCVEFSDIVDSKFLPIRCRIKKSDGGYNFYNFTKYGCWIDDDKAKCVIFPKGKTTWDGFVPPCKFKVGDVVISTCNNIHLISCHDKNYGGWESCCSIVYDKFDSTKTVHVIPTRFATEEEKQKLFNAIKTNGYKWNEETKTLEKLPKFKVGNVIQDIDAYRVKITEVNIEDECYEYESIFTKGIGSIPFIEQDNWELIPNKFDITTLKPFDKVLVRPNVHGIWGIDFFGFYNYNEGYYYTTGNCVYAQCIPYESNKHLLGTTKDCDEFYKNWK